MEARARRRLALLSSHMNPLSEASGTTSFSSLMASACACVDNGQMEIKKGEKDCVFCKIILGEAPALKVNFRFLFYFSFLVQVFGFC